MNGVLFRICLANFLLVVAIMMQLASVLFVGRIEGVFAQLMRNRAVLGVGKQN